MTDLVGTIVGSTQVTFPHGAVQGTATVQGVVPLDGGWGLVTDRTPFHPVDHTWPDHPADFGTVVVGGERIPVVDCVIGAVARGTGALLLGGDIPVRRGTEGWDWLVVHVVTSDLGGLGPGVAAELFVDEQRRRGLSAGHTACELVTLAINEAFADSWRKPVPGDVRGRPDFDTAALTVSRIHPYGSRDEYRLGKSLRKKGFVVDDLATRLPELTGRINTLMTGWVDGDLPVWVDAPGDDLTARRTWNCGLPDGTVTVPCGGTHVGSTGQLGAVTVTLELDAEASALTMDTALSPR
jgi:alanyl-tRNA synthetase